MVQKLGKEIISKAVKEKVQDIYIVPKKDLYELYMRIGNERKFIDVYDHHLMVNLISHFKFVAGMNVGEKRRSQLGSCDYYYNETNMVSLRLSTVGDYRGYESLVIRLLFDGRQDLHFWFNGVHQVLNAIRGRGLYLFSGPVGSGKTTLMYQIAREKFFNKQIITIEDPVEIKEANMLQLQLNENIGMTYDSLIKLSLRHRPDILIIGEIRDRETARAVIRASLTGVLVMSTVHAKSIPGVYARLLELGVNPKELENTLGGIIYQRLISGGGVLDFAKDKFQEHSAQKWNAQINRLFTEGYITEEEAEIEKIKN
ncbi:competence type IV pilus ATPase ComGA [Streptococcus macacae]|uniref:Type II/IV secretion system protein n=1 Tax=Streptococcus macacae NCTC 11558 TaxID=764298 RepID=G5JWA7_9STRE|nr:competence type IV pilus ATPase ComGA [Streptococcus macacae]EHJ52190.1 type II/IV secretion system protein [Streptococcus macacae NCTC 11558]SUN77762.1 ABC transporter ATP-binding protein [Streptococcus macacae NCTC 11558]